MCVSVFINEKKIIDFDEKHQINEKLCIKYIDAYESGLVKIFF